MHKSVVIFTLTLLIFLVPILYWLHPYLMSNPQLLWVSLGFIAIASVIVLFCLNIRVQVDDNPYYVDMIKAKREEVHMRQRLARMSLKE